MSRGRLNIPAELDVLDSPLSAVPGPFSGFSGLTGIPGSALAEKIFNDPDSWEDTDGEEGDYPEDVEDDTLVWLSEEIEKIRVHSAGNGAFQLSSEKRNSKVSDLLHAGEGNMDWRGIAQRGGVRPISLAGLFEQSSEDFSDDIQHQLSKILNSGGIKHHIGPRPLSATLSPALTSGSSATTDSIPSASSIDSSHLGDASPAPVQSASATLSFLEYYGIYPDSPLVDGRKSFLPRKKSVRRRPTLHVPSPLQNRTSLGITPSTASVTGSMKIPMIERTTPSTASVTGTMMFPVTGRIPDIPPPGLEVESRPMSPPGLNRPSFTQSRSLQDSESAETSSDEQVIEIHLPAQSVTSPRSRPLPTTTPSFPRSPSPFGKPLVATPIRRLPTIPPETTPSPPRLGTRHASYSTAPSTAVISPPANTSNSQAFLPLSAAFNTAGSTPFSPYPPFSSTLQTPQISSARLPSAARSPLGPVGPRTRGRNQSGDAGRPSVTGHRPPVLRL